jgi:hypothetical protein
MRTLIQIVPFLLLIFLIGSCTERIELDLDESYTRLLVDGGITNEVKSHRIQLATSGGYLGVDRDPPVSGATVTISDGTTIFPLEEAPDEPGCYYTDPAVAGIPGNIYTLNIELPYAINGTTFYTASCELFPLSPVDSIAIRWFDPWKVWEIQCFATDPPTVDFYMFEILVNDTMTTENLDEKMVVNDILYNGQYTNGIGVGYLEEEENLRPGDTVTLRMSRLTEDYAYFIWEAVGEAGYSNPLFGGPPANVKGNISNGAMGFFSASSVSYTSTVYSGTD